jgi:hypothetical protein
MLVTLRASQEEDEDDAEDFESEYEEETCHLAPEELNKAPVFVPVGLRSPEPVSAQTEETMEEVVWFFLNPCHFIFVLFLFFLLVDHYFFIQWLLGFEEFIF